MDYAQVMLLTWCINSLINRSLSIFSNSIVFVLDVFFFGHVWQDYRLVCKHRRVGILAVFSNTAVSVSLYTLKWLPLKLDGFIVCFWNHAALRYLEFRIFLFKCIFLN